MSIDLTTAVGRVRVMIGDTDETDLILTDAMIGLYVSGGALAQSSEYLAAAESAGAIAAKFARRAQSISEGGASVNWGDMAKRYRELALHLRATDEANEVDTADGLFDWAEQIPDEFSARERLRNEILRDSA